MSLTTWRKWGREKHASSPCGQGWLRLASSLLSHFFLFTRACYFPLLGPCLFAQTTWPSLNFKGKQTRRKSPINGLILTISFNKKKEKTEREKWLQDRKPCPSLFLLELSVFRCKLWRIWQYYSSSFQYYSDADSICFWQTCTCHLSFHYLQSTSYTRIVKASTNVSRISFS